MYGNKQFTHQAVLWNKNLRVAIETRCFDRSYPWGLFQNTVVSISLLSVHKSFPRNTKTFRTCRVHPSWFRVATMLRVPPLTIGWETSETFLHSKKERLEMRLSIPGLYFLGASLKTWSYLGSCSAMPNLADVLIMWDPFLRALVSSSRERTSPVRCISSISSTSLTTYTLFLFALYRRVLHKFCLKKWVWPIFKSPLPVTQHSRSINQGRATSSTKSQMWNLFKFM